MPRTQYSNYEGYTQPAWAGDFRSRDHLVPGPAHLNAAAFAADDNGRKPVKSGTVVGRTAAEEAAGVGFHPLTVAEGAVAEDQIYILAFDVEDAADIPECELYRPNSTVRINFLPEKIAGTLDAAVEAVLRELYIVQRGAE